MYILYICIFGGGKKVYKARLPKMDLYRQKGTPYEKTYATYLWLGWRFNVN